VTAAYLGRGESEEFAISANQKVLQGHFLITSVGYRGWQVFSASDIFSFTSYAALRIVPRITLAIASTTDATMSFPLSDSGFWVFKNCETFVVTALTSVLPALSNGTSQLTFLHSTTSLICKKNIAISRPKQTKYKEHISR
jgi:hypothetical protein